MPAKTKHRAQPVDRLDRFADRLEAILQRVVSAPPGINLEHLGSIAGWKDLPDSRCALHNATGLIWTLAPINGGAECTWSDAKKAAGALKLLDRTDWRLPHIRELFALVDHEKFSPVLPKPFKVPSSGWVWSSTPSAEYPDSNAWYLLLRYGFAGIAHQSSRGFALAVCGPVPPASQ